MIIKITHISPRDKCNQDLVFKVVTIFEAPLMTNKTVLTTTSSNSSVFQLYLVFYSRWKILKVNYFHETRHITLKVWLFLLSHRGCGAFNQPPLYNHVLQLRLKKKDSAPSHEKISAIFRIFEGLLGGVFSSQAKGQKTKLDWISAKNFSSARSEKMLHC